MVAAAERTHGQGITDPDIVRQAMLDARDAVKAAMQSEMASKRAG